MWTKTAVCWHLCVPILRSVNVIAEWRNASGQHKFAEVRVTPPQVQYQYDTSDWLQPSDIEWYTSNSWNLCLLNIISSKTQDCLADHPKNVGGENVVVSLGLEIHRRLIQDTCFLNKTDSRIMFLARMFPLIQSLNIFTKNRYIWISVISVIEFASEFRQTGSIAMQPWKTGFWAVAGE